MPPKKKTATKKKRRTKAKPTSRGLACTELTSETPPAPVQTLAEQVAADGGVVLGTYREPLGGHWQILAGLPVDLVAPIAFQRDLSDTHVKKLHGVLDRLDRYLDPIIAIRAMDGTYRTPNGHHRLEAMRRVGARSIVALLAPEIELAFQILALNTEKAPNLKDRSLEAIRMARALSELDDVDEASYEIELEEPSYLTLGATYEHKARFSGSAYQPILKKVDAFLEVPLSEALELRAGYAERLLDIDARVQAHVDALKAAGFTSPYLKPFVVARINPVRSPRASMEIDEAFDRIVEKAEAFNPSSVTAAQIGAAASYGGAG